MVNELQKHIEKDMIFFGLRESLKKGGKVEKVFIAKDCRADVVKKLNTTQLEIEQLSLNKKELADKFALPFECEVFGVRT